MQGTLSDKLRQARQAGKTMLPDMARSMVDAVAKRPASPVEVINKQHQSMIDSINKKSYSKNKFKRFF